MPISEDHYKFMVSTLRRLRSGSFQFLMQTDRKGTKAIGDALTKLQLALDNYNGNETSSTESNS